MSQPNPAVDGVSSPRPSPSFSVVVVSSENRAHNNRLVKLAVQLSAAANVALFSAKLFAYIISGSQAILASLADSGVDLASQLIVFLCDSKKRKVDRRYPIGKSRLETVGALIIACIMTFASFLVIRSSVQDLVTGFRTDSPSVPSMDVSVYTILSCAIVLKALLFVFCHAMKDVSDSTLALAQDHRNDVLSNIVVVIAAAISTSSNHEYWYVDPIGGIAISIFVIICWLMLASMQIAKIVGLSAPEEFRDKIHQIAADHEGIVEVDAIRAYHLGLPYFVEIDVVMPGTISLFTSHDVAVDLQKKIETLDEVERAFVHVDYARRASPEHKLDWSMI